MISCTLLWMWHMTFLILSDYNWLSSWLRHMVHGQFVKSCQDIPYFPCFVSSPLSVSLCALLPCLKARPPEDQVGGQYDACLPVLRREVRFLANTWRNLCDSSKNKIFLDAQRRSLFNDAIWGRLKGPWLFKTVPAFLVYYGLQEL